MRRSLFVLPLVLSTALFIAGCAPQRAPVPPGVVPQPKAPSLTDEQYGHQVFQELADHYEQDYNNPRAVEVQNVVDRLTKAAGAGKDPWHVYIFRDATVKNAAATRGNHVFIWSGMLDATKNEDELATVLAHEISHVLAGHTEPDPNEEVKKLLINVGAMAAAMAVGIATHGQFSGDLGNLTSSVTQGVGESLLVFPYSRQNELEADQIGLFLMARAKYNPQAAIDFWTRAETDPELSGGLSFLSTHPPAADRLARLQALLPAAIAQYKGHYDASTALASSSIPTAGVSAVAASPHPVSHQPGDTDSFDANKNVKQPKVIPNPAGTRSVIPPLDSATGEDWVVTAERAVVYVRPNASSHALGELRRGANVQVADSQGVWLKITRPDEGYVKKSLLQKSGALGKVP